jgi:uncharacterized RmlC-like cupin family protein
MSHHETAPHAPAPEWRDNGVRVVKGDRLDANTGDFIFVPPCVPHQEINASADETLECVMVRSDTEAVVVNLAIEPVEKPRAVHWVDPIHKHP